MKLKNKINVSLEYDGDQATLQEERIEELTNGLEIEFTLDIGVKEKTLRSGDRDCPDDVEVIVSHIYVEDLRFFDEDDEEVFPSDANYEEVKLHIKESIEF